MTFTNTESVVACLVLILGISAVFGSVLLLPTGNNADLTVQAQSGPEPEPDRDPNQLTIESINVENSDQSGGAIVTTEISSDVNLNHYPFKYPVTVQFEVVDPTTGDVVTQTNTSTVLRPSYYGLGTEEPESYEDGLGGYRSQVEATFRMQQDSDTQYDFVVRSRLEDNPNPTEFNAARSSSFTVTGSNDRSSGNVSGVIQASDGFRELPTVESVANYRSSDTNPDYLEDMSIPDRADRDYSGNVYNFAGMTQSNSDSATIESNNGQMTIVTSSDFVQSNEPQNVIIEHNLTGVADEIEVVPINAQGEEIDEDREYTLTEGSNDYCSTFGDSSVCVYTLSETEMDYVNRHGELYLSYESSNPNARAEIMCQDIVSGGLDYSNSDVCGLSDISSDPVRIYEGVVSEFTIIDGGSFIDEDGVVEVSESELSNITLGVEVENVGTEPIRGDEPIHIFDESTITDPSIDSSTTTVNETPNGDSYTVSLGSDYPTSGMELVVDGETYSGTIEMEIVASNGQTIERTVSNVSGETAIDLSGLGGYTSDITVNATSEYKTGANQPEINELTVNATDKDSVSEVNNLEVGSMTGGSGTLDPGESRVHELSGLDLVALSNGSNVSLAAEFINDREELVLKIDDEELVADAGGPYQIEISDVDSVETETVGYTTIESDRPPGPDWEPIGSGSNPSQIEYRTNHEDIPQISASAEDSVAYWIANDYMEDHPKELLPQEYEDMYDNGQLTMSIEYEEFQEYQRFVGTSDELSTYDTRPNSWSQSGYSGERLQHGNETERYNIEYGQLTPDRDNSNNIVTLESTIASSDQIFFNHLSSSQPSERIITSTVQYSNPIDVTSSARGYQQCNATDTCWRSVESAGETDPTIRAGSRQQFYQWGPGATGSTSDYVYCQNDADVDIDLGSSWTIAGFGDSVSSLPSSCEVEWVRANTETQDLENWELVTDDALYEHHIPQFETYNVYERQVYDISVEFEYNATGNTQLYEGPVKEFTGKINDQTISVNGEQSREKSTVEIEEAKWYLNDQEDPVATGLTTDIQVDRSGEYDLRLEVAGGGLSDEDTTELDVNTGCFNIVECEDDDSDRVYPRVEPPNTLSESGGDPFFTRRVDNKYGRVAIETVVDNVSMRGNEDYDYEMTVSPAQATDSSGEPINDPQAEKVFWEGENIPYTGMRQIAYVNPQENAAISPTGEGGVQEFTIRMYAENVDSGDTEIVQTETVSVHICEAEQGELGNRNTEFMCEEGFDSDMDGTPDVDDECPYDPRFTREPCELGEEKQTTTVDLSTNDITFGENVEGNSSVNGWTIDATQEKSPVLATEPGYAQAIGSPYADKYDQETLQYGYSLQYGPEYDPSSYYLDGTNVVGMWLMDDNFNTGGSINDDLYWYSPDATNIGANTTTGGVAIGDDFGMSFYNEQQRGEISQYQINAYDPYGNKFGELTLTPDEYDSYNNGGSTVDFSTGPSTGVTGGIVLDATFNNAVTGDAELIGSKTSNDTGLTANDAYATVEQIDSPITYESDAPIGGGTAYSGSEYLGLANPNGSPGTDSLGVGQSQNLHQDLASQINSEGGYNVSFWYRQNRDEDTQSELMIRRRNSGQADSIVATSEIGGIPDSDELQRDFSDAVTYTETPAFFIGGISVDNDCPLLSVTCTSGTQTDGQDFLSSSVPDQEESLDEIVFIDHTKVSGMNKSVILEYKKDSDSTSLGYSDSNPSDSYYVEEFTPISDRQPISQNNITDDGLIYELTEIPISEAYSDSSNNELPSQGPAQSPPFGSYSELLLVSSSPYEERLSDTSEVPIEALYSTQPSSSNLNAEYINAGDRDGWQLATLEVDSSSNTVTYVGGAGSDATALNDLESREVTINSPLIGSAGSGNVELFMGAGWKNPEAGSIIGFTDKGWTNYNGAFSGIVITSNGISTGSGNSTTGELFPGNETVFTQERTIYDDQTSFLNSLEDPSGSDPVEGENTPEASLITSENIGHEAALQLNSMNPEITVYAQPTERFVPNSSGTGGTFEEIGPSESYGEYIMKNKNLDSAICTSDADQVDSSNSSQLYTCQNTLTDGEFYSAFRLEIQVESNTNSQVTAGRSFELDTVSINSDGQVNAADTLDIVVQSFRVDTSDSLEQTPNPDIGEVRPVSGASKASSQSGGGLIMRTTLANNSTSFDVVDVIFRNDRGEVMYTQKTSTGDIQPDGTVVSHMMNWNELLDFGLTARDTSYSISVEVRNQEGDLLAESDTQISGIDKRGEFYICPTPPDRGSCSYTPPS